MVEMITSPEMQQIVEILSKHSGLDALIAIAGLGAFYSFKKFSRVITDKVEKALENPHGLVLFDKTVGDKVRTNSLVKRCVEEFMQKTGCYKVLISQFHNGGNLVSGTSFLKSSVTHEFNNSSVPNNTKLVQKDYLQIPLSFYTYYLQTLRKSKVLFIKNIEDIKTEDMGTYLRFKQMGAKGAVILGIYKENCLVGFITTLFRTTQDNNITSVKKEALKLASKIDLLLTQDTEEDEEDTM